MSHFHDHFSSTAASYSTRRPTYPPAFIAAIAEACPNRKLAWDVGTGNGQAAVLLGDHFESVQATDASAAQIAKAKPHPRVTYRVATERESGLDDASVDFVTVAQALHWFDLPAFYDEVRRVLKPEGFLAVWCYGNPAIDESIDPIVEAFYSGRVGPYWPPERKHIATGYRELHFPFEEIPFRPQSMTDVQTREEFVEYVGTWSAVSRYRAIEGNDPLPLLRESLSPVWPDGERKSVIRPLAIRMGRVRK